MAKSNESVRSFVDSSYCSLTFVCVILKVDMAKRIYLIIYMCIYVFTVPMAVQVSESDQIKQVKYLFLIHS